MIDTTTLPMAALPDAPSLLATDHVELYVGNARQAAHYYCTAFGFGMVAYAGPETGIRDRASYVVQQGKIRLVLTAPLQPLGEIAEHVRLHGDGVHGIALRVTDCRAAYRAAVARGARSLGAPRLLRDKQGVVRMASIATYGNVVHTFVERDEYDGAFLPGYREERRHGEGVGVRFIDHTVGNVAAGEMDAWVRFYADAFGFSVSQEFTENDVATRYSALRSKVVRDPHSMITFPINEPAAGLRASQIQEYLNYHHGAGVQHIALHTDNIVSTVAALRRRGVEFLHTPDSYYDALAPRIAAAGEDVEKLRDLRILVDFEEGGHLLQVFTKPVADRPTLFYEVIERRGATGFGKGNFKALFEAIEREQAARGNL